MNKSLFVVGALALSTVLGLNSSARADDATTTPATPAAPAAGAPAAPDQAPVAKPKHHTDSVLQYAKELNLTDDQKASIKKIESDTKAQLKALSADDRKGQPGKDLKKAETKSIREVLTSDQRATLKQLKAEAKAKKAAAAAAAAPAAPPAAN
jgi:Spy/CpxP family protein refolding chaperone